MPDELNTTDRHHAGREAVAEVYEDLARKREQQIGSLFDAIAHGSDEHRAWLKKAIEDHFAGRPVERPHG